MVPAPAGHIALWRNSRRRRLLLGFLPAAPHNSEVDPRRQRGSEPLRARGATGELRGAQHRPAGSGHTDPRAPVAAASCPSGRPPPLAAGVQSSSRLEPEVSVAAATRAAPLCAGKRPRLSPSPWPSPCPRSPREEGAAREAGTERARRAQQTLSTRGVRSLPAAALAGRRNDARPKGRRGLGPRAPRGLRSCAEHGPQRSRLSPWWRAGKKSARDAGSSSASRKGQRSPEDFRECTRVGVRSSLPKCRGSALKVRHVRRGRTLEGLTHQNAGPTPASGREWRRRPVPRGAGGRVLTRSGAGVFRAKPRRSRALRRVVAEPFRARISAGSPPEVSKAPGAPSCSHPGAFPGHSSSQSAPCLRALKLPEAPRRSAGAGARRTGVGSGER